MAIQDYKHKLLLNVNIKLIIVLQKVKFSLDLDGESSSASKEAQKSFRHDPQDGNDYNIAVSISFIKL